MKSVICLSLLSFLFLSPAGVWGMENTVEFTGDLETFKARVRQVQERASAGGEPLASDSASRTIHVTVTVPDEYDFDLFIDEIKKENLATLKVTKSPAGTANYLIAGLQQEEGWFPKLTELDLSENKNVGGGFITFCGLEDLLQKIPIQTLRLAKNDLSETMDFVLGGILSSENRLTTLDLSHTNPTPQMLSHLIHPLMSKARKTPLTLILRDNSLKAGHISVIKSLLSTTNGQSRSLEDLDLRNCHIPKASLEEAVKYYFLQRNCSHLLCDDQPEDASSSAASRGFLVKPIGSLLDLLRRDKKAQESYGITAIDFLERLKTFSEDNPGFKLSLQLKKSGDFLLYVDGLLDDLASPETSARGRKSETPQDKQRLELKEYFTNLFASPSGEKK